MTQYQFEKIYSRMGKEFKKIRPGEEEDHLLLLSTLEQALMKEYREHPASNSHRLKEAIALTLFDIRSRYTGETYDLSSFRNEDNARLENCLLMAFDPFTNDTLRKTVEEDGEIDLTDRESLRSFYSESVAALLRIYDSVLLQEKRYGSNGYFDFLEDFIGGSFDI